MELRLQATQGTALEGMAVGNLILGTLTQSVGNIGTATRSLSELLSVTETVLPASVDNIHLRAVLDDGKEIEGELDIRRPGKAPIRSMTVHPATARVWKDTEIMLRSADVVILGPGSLWTSLGAVLAVPGVTAAIADSGAKVVFICNTTTQPGQTDGLDLVGHVNTVSQLLNRVPDVVIANSAPITDVQFTEAGLMPVRPAAGDAELLAGMNSTLIAADLIGSETLTTSLWQKLHTAYHDMNKLADAIVSLESFTTAKN